MGKIKYKSEIESLFKKSPIVTHNSLSRIIMHNHGSPTYAKRMINYMLKNGAIKRLAKGCYTSRDDISLAVFCFQPAYLGLQDALSFHNLWEQETVPIILTSRNIRPGIRIILERNVIIRKIEKKYLFGMAYHQYENVAIPYSDVEKTFIDMVHFKQPLDKEVIKNFKERINKTKLKEYLKKYSPLFRKKVRHLLN